MRKHFRDGDVWVMWSLSLRRKRMSEWQIQLPRGLYQGCCMFYPISYKLCWVYITADHFRKNPICLRLIFFLPGSHWFHFSCGCSESQHAETSRKIANPSESTFIGICFAPPSCSNVVTGTILKKNSSCRCVQWQSDFQRVRNGCKKRSLGMCCRLLNNNNGNWTIDHSKCLPTLVTFTHRHTHTH